MLILILQIFRLFEKHIYELTKFFAHFKTNSSNKILKLRQLWLKIHEVFSMSIDLTPSIRASSCILDVGGTQNL